MELITLCYDWSFHMPDGTSLGQAGCRIVTQADLFLFGRVGSGNKTRHEVEPP